ncbi:MAG TPA: hypothetical protein VGF86_03365 [Candidatus Tumulicola sp.]|jgi:hypothetical protein
MVRQPAFRIATWIALLSLSAAVLPIAAAADGGTDATATHYSTAITTVYGSQYPIAGHLDLEIAPSGTLRGYYHNAYQKAFIQVVGGRDGSYIWFDIGPSPIDIGLGIGTGERLHIVATMNGDGSFRGQAFPQMTLDNVSRLDNASQMTSPVNQATANDQYIFAATPVEKGPEDYQGP